MAAFRKFAAASRSAKQTILAAAIAVVLVRAGLWVLPFPALLKVLEYLGKPGRIGVHRASSASEVADAVTAIARRVPVATCLTRALSLNMLLLRRGEPNDIKIGIARDGAKALKSHAWVEQDGRVLIGDNGDLGLYTTLVSLKGAGNLLGRG